MPRTRASYRPWEKTKEHKPVVLAPSAPSAPSGQINQTQTQLFDSVKQGLGFGIGSAIAREAVGSIFRKEKEKEPSLDCMNLRKEFDECVLDSLCTKEHANELWKKVRNCNDSNNY
jgi:hypothetical protein